MTEAAACWATRLVAIAMMLVPFAADAQSSAGPASRASAARMALETAIAKPADEAAFRAFLQTLPRVALPGGVTRYVVESDLLLTEDEARSLLARNLARTRALNSGLRPELIVNEVNGRPDFWVTVADRQLTYAIDRSTFSPSELAVVDDAMARATADWVDACAECQLTFTHRAEFDDRPDPASVTFIVRQVDAHGSFIAASFFPSDPAANRFLNIDPSYFTTDFDRTGVLRHELGHVIGYRHEHTRGVKGCYYEDAHWIPLTAYDPQSVMHYLCGGGGSPSLELTQVDIAGHRQQYAIKQVSSIPASLRRPSDVSITLRFEGGDVSRNMFASLGVLAERGQLLTEEVTAKDGDNPCALVRAALSLPKKIGCSDALVTRLWSAMNAGVKPGAIPAGRPVTVPANFEFSTYQFAKTFDSESDRDRKRQDQLTANWGSWVVRELQSSAAITRVVLEGYQLRTRLASAKGVPATLTTLETLRSENFYVETSGWSTPTQQKLHASGWSGYPTSCKTTTPPPKADYAEIVFGKTVASCEKICTTNCAQVMLIDTQVAQHPKLARALSLDPPASVEAPSCNALDWEDTFHGTHLAGIVAAMDTSSGMVGLSPSSHLRPFVLPNANVDSVVADYVNDWAINGNDSTGSKIFLFASEFTVRGEVKTSQYPGPENRFADSRSSKAIRDAVDVLLVVAAGQADTKLGEERQTLYPTSKVYPMNLGDLANVIVVTACEDCDKIPTALMASGNIGKPVDERQSLVNIVAPGGSPIPGLVNSNATDVAMARGTSQAAAFTAGTAAAAANCFPGAFSSAGKLKRRILVTSRPTLKVSEDTSVNAGVLDYELATRDPRQDWYRPNGKTDYESVKAGWWCSKELEYKQSWGESTKIGTSRVRRLYKTQDGDGPAAWFLYADDPRNLPLGLVKIGPVQLLGDSKLLKLIGASERVVGTDTISDILLADRAINVGACSGGG